jgi:hypothetical protein
LYYPGGFPFVGDYARDNPVYYVHVDSPMRPPLPPSNTATKTPNLPAPRRQADRLPSTMAALAAIADARSPTGREKMRHVMHDCGYPWPSIIPS